MAAVNGRRIGLGPRPARDPRATAWVRGSEATGKGDLHAARLTVDVTPDLRGRSQVTALQRGLTVAEMLRTLLERGQDLKSAGRGKRVTVSVEIGVQQSRKNKKK